MAVDRQDDDKPTTAAEPVVAKKPKIVIVRQQPDSSATNSRAAVSRGKVITINLKSNKIEAQKVIQKPDIPSTLLNYSVIKDDHAKHFIQHGAESRNPYEKLVAKLEGLPVICISALGSETDAFGKAINYDNKDFSPLMKSGAITQGDKTMIASLPYYYVLAAAVTAKRLGGDNSMLTSRVTVWAQDSIPNAPKPPATKLKTGKGGISGGVIPVDLSTTTNEGPNGTLVALKQNENHRPSAEEKDITTVQWAKPLEQVIAGLTKDPPDFLMISDDKTIKEKGYIEFKMNCVDDSGVNQAAYRINLRQESADNKATVKPINQKQTTATEPSWWSNDFGDFATKAREAYHVDYKKSPDQAEFKSYDVYARLGEDGSKLPLSGDQDLFFIPRSEKYELGALATEVVDTHALNGVENLVDKMKEVHRSILKEDLQQGKISKEDLQSSITNFYNFLDSSHDYIEALGMITPYEAYFTVQLNNQVAQIREQYKDNPEELANLVKSVNVDVSYGISNLKTIDFDINTAWFKENPAEISKRIDKNLQAGLSVAPEVMELYAKCKYEGNRQRSVAISPESIDDLTEQVRDVASKEDCKAYMKIQVKEHPPTLPGEEPTKPPYYKWVEYDPKANSETKKGITAFMLDVKTEMGQRNSVLLMPGQRPLSTLADEKLNQMLSQPELQKSYKPR